MELVTLLKHLLTLYYLIKLWVNKSFYTYKGYNKPFIWRRIIWLLQLSGSFEEVLSVYKKPVRDSGQKESFLSPSLPCNPAWHCQMPLMPAPPTHSFLWPTPRLFLWWSAGNDLLSQKCLHSCLGRIVAWIGVQRWGGQKQRKIIYLSVLLVQCKTFLRRTEVLAWEGDKAPGGRCRCPGEWGRGQGVSKTAPLAHGQKAPLSGGIILAFLTPLLEFIRNLLFPVFLPPSFLFQFINSTSPLNYLWQNGWQKISQKHPQIGHTFQVESIRNFWLTRIIREREALFKQN